VRGVSDPLPTPPSERQLGTAAWTDLDATTSDPPVLLVPIGSCEQHGPHLPLDTDTRVACAIAAEVAARSPGLLVTPPQTVSSSGEHQGFPGTLSIGAAATEMLLVELGRSADWSGGVVFINGHGGNRAAVDRAVELLAYEGRNILSWWPRIAGGDAHAGATETSLMLTIAPELVRVDDVAPGNTVPLSELLPLLEHGGLRAVSPRGVLGDPTSASAAAGADLLEALVADALRRIAAWRATLGR